MNLYLITQDSNTDYGAYEFAVVAAETEEEAKTIHPYDENISVLDGQFIGEYGLDTWAEFVDQVRAEYLGIAKEGTKKRIIALGLNGYSIIKEG